MFRAENTVLSLEKPSYEKQRFLADYIVFPLLFIAFYDFYEFLDSFYYLFVVFFVEFLDLIRRCSGEGARHVIAP